MNRTQSVLTLVLVAVAAMLLGLTASLFLARRADGPREEQRPKATEPGRPLKERLQPRQDGARRVLTFLPPLRSTNA